MVRGVGGGTARRDRRAARTAVAGGSASSHTARTHFHIARAPTPPPHARAEELYTSKLDVSKISRRDQERAARIEREILHGSGRHGGGGGGGGPLAGNIHMMEERGTDVVDTGLTEEER